MAWKCKIQKVLDHSVMELLKSMTIGNSEGLELEDYPVGVTDKQGVRGVLCTTRCKEYLCQNCTRGRKRALHFSEKLRRMPWTKNKYPKTTANASHVQPQARTSSQIGADIEMQETAWNARTVSSRSGQKQKTKQRCTNSNTAPTALRYKLTNIRLITEYLKQ